MLHILAFTLWDEKLNLLFEIHQELYEQRILVERTHMCFWQIKGVNFQFRMVTSETKNHIMHPFALLLFDWLMAVTLHCSLPLLATDQNANLQMPRFENQITQMLLLSMYFQIRIVKFRFYLPLSFNAIQIILKNVHCSFSFLWKSPPENQYQMQHSKVTIFCVEEQTNENSTDDLADNAI